MKTDKLLRISPSSIDVGPIPFDLFVQRENTLILFCRSGLPITEKHIKTLERRTNPFYVKKKQWVSYVEYAEESLPLILVDSDIDTSYRSEVMHALSLKHLDAVLYAEEPEKALDGLRDLADSYIDYLYDTPEGAIHLFKRSEADSPLLQRSINCATFNVMIGQKLLPNEKQLVVELALAGMLHDIGMKFVDQEILDKQERLTPEEFDEVKKHCLLGADLLTRLKVPKGVVMAALSHHERFDGSGYMEGLSGKNIHPTARITAISDVYDAITSDRAYADKKQHIDALVEMKSMSHLFDEQMIGALADVVLRNETLIQHYNHDTIMVDPLEIMRGINRSSAATGG
jgi:HD-GYP domain-containing protein (c-di-GMP phosphodiesterase class II)